MNILVPWRVHLGESLHFLENVVWAKWEVVGGGENMIMNASELGHPGDQPNFRGASLSQRTSLVPQLSQAQNTSDGFRNR